MKREERRREKEPAINQISSSYLRKGSIFAPGCDGRFADAAVGRGQVHRQPIMKLRCLLIRYIVIAIAVAITITIGRRGDRLLSKVPIEEGGLSGRRGFRRLGVCNANW